MASPLPLCSREPKRGRAHPAPSAYPGHGAPHVFRRLRRKAEPEAAFFERGVFENPDGKLCFAGALLQVLFHVPAVARGLRAHNCFGGCAADCPGGALRAREKSTQDPSARESCDSLRHVLGTLGFESGMQHDSVELLARIAADASSEWLTCATITHSHRVETACPLCPDQTDVVLSSTEDTFIELYPAPGAVSVDVATLRAEANAKERVGDTRRTCPCGCPARVERSCRPTRTSEVLLLGINRTMAGGKNFVRVTTLSPIIVCETKYELRGVLEHKGAVKSQGHYVAHIVYPGHVVTYDDEHRSLRVTLPEDAWQNSRLLVYAREVCVSATPVSLQGVGPLTAGDAASDRVYAGRGAADNVPELSPFVDVSDSRSPRAPSQCAPEIQPSAAEAASVANAVGDVDFLDDSESAEGDAEACTGLLRDADDDARQFGDRVCQLLDAYVAGEDCWPVLASFPMYCPSVTRGGSTEVLRRFASSLQLLGGPTCYQAHAAVETSVPLWRTLPYPLAVLFAALSKATSFPLPFYCDSFLGLASSIFHKSLEVRVAGHAARARFWSVGTAEPGSGKSPSLDPLRALLFEVLAEHEDMAPGARDDRFHMQQGTTHAAALDRLRATDGYLLVASAEAGPLLCPTWPHTSAWNPGTHINYQKFLDAGNGGPVPWETMFDRRKTKDTAGAAPPRAVDFEVTNVTFIFLQQVSYFTGWWCLSEARSHCGLAARFLHSFASQSAPGPAVYRNFASDVAFPLIKACLRVLLLHVGPHVPHGADNPRQCWAFTESQEAFIRTAKVLCHDAIKRLPQDRVGIDRLSKFTYWVSQCSLHCSLLEQLLPFVLSRRSGAWEFSARLSDEALRTAMEFFPWRYLFGLAVLDGDIRARSWLSPSRPLTREVPALVRRVLRHCGVHVLKPTDVSPLGPPFRDLESRDPRRREQAVASLSAVFANMTHHGLGCVEKLPPWSCGQFRKFHYAHLSSEAQAFLVTLAVPPYNFGALTPHKQGLHAKPRGHVDVTAMVACSAAPSPGLEEVDATHGACEPTRVSQALHVQPTTARSVSVDVHQPRACPTVDVCGSGEGNVADVGDHEALGVPSAKRARHDCQGSGHGSIDVALPPIAEQEAIALATTAAEEHFQETHDGAPWTAERARQRIREVLARGGCRLHVHNSHITTEHYAFTVSCRCVTCPGKWSATYSVGYYGGAPPRTLRIERRASPRHGEDEAAGRLLPALRARAAEVLDINPQVNLRGLREALRRHVPQTELPRGRILGNWLASEKRRRAGAPAGSQRCVASVATVEEILAGLQGPVASQAPSHTLRVLPGVAVSQEVCFIPFTCEYFRQVLARYTCRPLALAADVKMNCLHSQLGIMSMGFLVKHHVARTTASRQGRRSQTMQHTTKFVPLMQAVVHSEASPYWARLLREADAFFGRAVPFLADVRQLHKDWAPGAEHARRLVLPGAHSCDDFAHLLRNARKALAGKLRARTAVPGLRGKGSYVLTFHGRCLLFLEAQHVAPTLSLHHALWTVFLRTMESPDLWAEAAAAEYLRQEYVQVLTPDQSRAVFPVTTETLYSSSWCGCCGLIPGTGCGSQPIEAFHSSWQRGIAARGGKVSLRQCFDAVQAEYVEVVKQLAAHEASA